MLTFIYFIFLLFFFYYYYTPHKHTQTMFVGGYLFFTMTIHLSIHNILLVEGQWALSNKPCLLTCVIADIFFFKLFVF